MESIDDIYFDQDIYAPKSKRVYNNYSFIGAIILIIIGFLTISQGIGILLIMISLYIIFTKKGIKIDTRNNHFKEYIKYLGLFENGKWEKNKIFEQISIISKIKDSKTQKEVLKTKPSDYDSIVVLLDKSNHKKLVIYYTNDIEEAKYITETLSEKTNFPIVSYNPI